MGDEMKFKVIGVVVILLMASAAVGLAIDSAKWRGVAAANLEESDRLGNEAAELRSQNVSLGQIADAAMSHAEGKDEEFQAERDQWVRDAAASDERILELERRAEERSAETDAQLTELQAEMDPVVFAKVNIIVVGLRDEISIREGITEEMRQGRAREKKRADDAETSRDLWKNSSETFRLANVGLKDEISTSNDRIAAFERATEALDKSINPTFGVKVKVGWPFAVVGFAAGVLLTRN